MQIGEGGLAILRCYEQGPHGGFARLAYRCPAGVWTAGYGHTKGVKAGDQCDAEQAERWLREDCAEAEDAVNNFIGAPLNQNQFDALVCLVFNIGRGRPDSDPRGPAGFHGSTLLRLLNAGDYTGAAEQFPRWNKAGGVVLNGLVARRADEKALFLS